MKSTLTCLQVTVCPVECLQMFRHPSDLITNVRGLLCKRSCVLHTVARAVVSGSCRMCQQYIGRGEPNPPPNLLNDLLRTVVCLSLKPLPFASFVAHRRGLQCIYPEMPRTHTFGKVGAHGGLYFDEYLAPMVINNQNIDWRTQDLDYLLQDKYAELMGFWISQAQDFLADNTTSLGGYCNNTLSTDATHMSDLLVEYDSLQAANSTTSFTSLAREVGHMMEGLVLGKVPRASYNGVVVVRCRGRRLFLVPSTELPGKITEGPRLG